MVAAERGGGIQFDQPLRQITMMLAVIGLVAVGSYASKNFVVDVFEAFKYLNGVILGVFLVGLLACFWQIGQIIASVRWIDDFVEGNAERGSVDKAPRLLASLAALLGQRGAKLQLTSTSTQSILESVATRMDESRDITRYLSNLLIFLGLLGTFYGLAITVPAVVDVIRSLEPKQGEDSIAVFSRLMDGLERQLGGMGTAFSSSLLGLAGSLVVGLLDLFAGHGQNRFYRQLEEWLSGITRIGLSHGEADIEGSSISNSSTAVAVFADQVAEFSRSLEYADLRQNDANENLGNLISSLTAAVERQSRILDPEDAESGVKDAEIAKLLEKISSDQQAIIELLETLSVNFSDVKTSAALDKIQAELVRGNADAIEANENLLWHLQQSTDTLSTGLRDIATGRSSRLPQRRRDAEQSESE